MKNFLAFALIVVALIVAAGYFNTASLVSSAQSIQVPARAELTIMFLRDNEISGETEYVWKNPDPQAATFTLQPESCCNYPSQPCYPQCSMNVGTNYYSLQPIKYAGNEGFKYIYYSINGCWTGSAGEASPSVRISDCQLLPLETQPLPPDDGGDEPPAIPGNTIAEIVWNWLMSVVSYIRGLFNV